MPKMIKNGQIVENEWTLITEPVDKIPTGKAILSWENWQQHRDSTDISSTGLWLHNNVDLNNIDIEWSELPVIAIDFPVFMDGRGFSLARLLRDQYGYTGELRATGAVIRDQLCYLKRCGFDAFDLDESIDLEKALASLDDFSESYQVSSDQGEPLFRRRP